MKEKVLSFLILLLVSFSLNAQEIGANYNENIDYPITEIDMLRHANITWVRGFVNISNPHINLLFFDFALIYFWRKNIIDCGIISCKITKKILLLVGRRF